MRRIFWNLAFVAIGLYTLQWSCAGMIRGTLAQPKTPKSEAWAIHAANEPALFWIAALVFFGVGCACPRRRAVRALPREPRRRMTGPTALQPPGSGHALSPGRGGQCLAFNAGVQRLACSRLSRVRMASWRATAAKSSPSEA